MNQYQRHGTYRSDGSRSTPHQNGYQTGYGNGYGGGYGGGYGTGYGTGYGNRNRHNNEWQREYRNSNRTDGRPDSGSDGRQQSNGTQMPGFPVKRNNSSTPFPSTESIADNAVNDSGDQVFESQVEDISKQLNEIEIKSKEETIDSEKVVIDDNEDKKSTENEELTTTSEVKSEFESKDDIKVVSNGTPNGNQIPRRNTIGSEFRNQNYRHLQRRNYDMNHKFENFRQFNTNRNPNNKFLDQNKRNKGLKKYVPQIPQKTDLVANYSAVNPYVESYNQFPQYMIQNSYFMTSGVNYGVSQTQGMSSNTGEVMTESCITQKQTENDQMVKHSEQTNSNEVMSLVPYFIPFEPSQVYPVPPQYFGRVIPYNTSEGIYYYFVIPNVAPLLLEVTSGGEPILPSNCYRLQ